MNKIFIVMAFFKTIRYQKQNLIILDKPVRYNFENMTGKSKLQDMWVYYRY